MSLLDKMLAAKGVKPMVAGTVADAAPLAKPDKVRSIRVPPDGNIGVTKSAPAVVAPITVKAQCGHDVLVETPNAKFLKQQIANIEGKKCKACRQEAHQQLLARQAEHARLNPKPKKKPKNTGERTLVEWLPDNACFVLRYNAEKVLWSGSLEIPGMEIIVLQNKAVFKLLQKLDAEYRKQTGEAPCTSG